jgi:hypothetical protein
MSDDVEPRHKLIDAVFDRKAYHRTDAHATECLSVPLALVNDHAAILSLEQRPQRQSFSFAMPA